MDGNARSSRAAAAALTAAFTANTSREHNTKYVRQVRKKLLCAKVYWPSILYPNPLTVLIYFGFAGSSSILARRLEICTIMVLSSLS